MNVELTNWCERNILSAWMFILQPTRADKLYSHIVYSIYYILITYVYFMWKQWLYMITSTVFTTSNKNINQQRSNDKKLKKTRSNEYI